MTVTDPIMGFRLYDGPDGWFEQPVKVIRPGIGTTTCFVCRGCGVYTEPDNVTVFECVDCKGNGIVHVSI